MIASKISAKSHLLQTSQFTQMIYFLIIGIWVVYGRALTFDFIHFLDDDLYIYGNPHLKNGLTWASFKWSFLADLIYNSRHADYWQPVTFLFRALDISLYGVRAAGHHLTNLVIHTLNTIILFLVFRKLTAQEGRSFCLAVFFAFHPLQVEAIAWVTARKDLLSTFFALLTLFVYTDQIKKPSGSKMLAMVACFSLSLMSKPNLILLPAILIGLDYYVVIARNEVTKQSTVLGLSAKMQGEIRPDGFRRIFGEPRRPEGLLAMTVEKWPLFFISICAFFLFYFAKSGVENGIPPHFQVANISKNYIFYLSKIIYPTYLSIYNISLKNGVFFPDLIICVLLLAAITSFSILNARRYPYLLAGIFWFLLASFPSITRHYADRFMYFPMIGLSLMIVWGIHDLLTKHVSFYKKIRTPLIIFVFFVFAASSFKQVGYWKNSEMLFAHALETDPGNDQVLNGLGNILMEKGALIEAGTFFSKAISIRSDNIDAQNNLGVILLRQGKTKEAEVYFKKAIQDMPASAESHHNLGVVFEKEGFVNEAVSQYQESVRIEPDFIMAYNKLGVLAAKAKQYRSASDYFSKSLSIDPQDSCALHNMAVLRGETKGQFES